MAKRTTVVYDQYLAIPPEDSDLNQIDNSELEYQSQYPRIHVPHEESDTSFFNTDLNKLFASYNGPPAEDTTFNDSPTAFSVDQQRQIQYLWSGQKRGSSVQLIRVLWQQVTVHGADNIFSDPQANDYQTMQQENSTRGIDDECLYRLIVYCRQLRELSQNLTSCNAKQAQRRQPFVADDEFPFSDLLTSGLKSFFQAQHLSLPFIHLTSFDAISTPISLLLSMVFIGLAYASLSRNKQFILLHITVSLIPANLYKMFI